MKFDIITTTTAATVQPVPLRPTVFVGLGGTGLKVLARLRRRISERFGDPDFWPTYGFFGIDSNKNDLALGGVVGQSGLPIPERHLFNIGMTTDEVDDLRNNPKSVAHIMQWFDPSDHELSSRDYTVGAGQIRSMGRMMFVHRIQDIREQLKDHCQRVCSQDALEAAQSHGAQAKFANQGAMDVDVVVVSSIAGGTGSGCYLDCAFLLRQMRAEGMVQLGDVRVYLVLPDIFHSVLPEAEIPTVYANAYAALQEMEYYNDCLRHPFATSAWGDIGNIQQLREHPFDACYLFAGGNPSPLQSPEEMYDLLADALAFSVGGGDLADSIRSSWAQARKTYSSVRRSQVLYTEGPLEGGPPHERPGQSTRTAISFSRTVSTRFSSLGISSATMKLAELRRLAAVRLLRRIVAAEIGEKPKRDTETLERAESLFQRIAAREDFTGTFESTVESNALAAADSAKDADDAARRARDILRELHEGADQIDSASAASIPFVETLLAAANESADQIAQTTCDPLYNQTSNYEDAKTLLDKTLAKLKRKTDDLESAAPLPSIPRDPPPKWFTQWKDLENFHGTDPFGLARRAHHIVTCKFRDWLLTLARAYVRHINTSLRKRYLDRVADSIKQYADQIDSQIRALSEWNADLRKMQNEMASQFASERNLCLTSHLAPHADDDTKQELLDREIDRAARLRPGDTDALLRARNSVLTALATKLQLGQSPCSLLKTYRDVASQRFRVLDDLVDVTATDFLKDLPEVNDVFKAMALQKRNINADILPKVTRRAEAYWPLMQKTEFRNKLEAFKVFGAPQSQEAAKEWGVVKSSLEDAGWSYKTTDPKSMGELVLVNEVHGYALPSLTLLPQFRKAYDRLKRDGQLRGRHADFRLVSQLPDLLAVDQREAEEQIDAIDHALLAIMLGIITWNPPAATYQYLPRNLRPYNLGDSHESVATWLRSADGLQFADSIRTQVKNWFTDLVTAANEPDDTAKQAEAVKTCCRPLVFMELALRLMGEHCFPLEQTGDSWFSPPGHTMIRRIKHKWVDTYFKHICESCSTIDAEQLRESLTAECAPILHRFTTFVGPKPPADADKALRRQHLERRILALRKPHDTGRDVLDEAFLLDWFPDIQVATKATSLFADQIKQPNGNGRPTVISASDFNIS